MLSVYCISHVPALMTLDIPGFEGKKLLLIAFLVATVQGSDVLQYVFGKLFGKHRIAPNISPSKTWKALSEGSRAHLFWGLGLPGSHRFRHCKLVRWPRPLASWAFSAGLWHLPSSVIAGSKTGDT